MEEEIQMGEIPDPLKGAEMSPLNSFDFGDISALFSPINEFFSRAQQPTASPLNPEKFIFPETALGVSNSSTVTGNPVQLPVESELPPREEITVKLESVLPEAASIFPEASISSLTQSFSQFSSAINETLGPGLNRIESISSLEKISTESLSSLEKITQNFFNLENRETAASPVASPLNLEGTNIFSSFLNSDSVRSIFESATSTFSEKMSEVGPLSQFQKFIEPLSSVAGFFGAGEGSQSGLNIINEEKVTSSINRLIQPIEEASSGKIPNLLNFTREPMQMPSEKTSIVESSSESIEKSTTQPILAKEVSSTSVVSESVSPRMLETGTQPAPGAVLPKIEFPSLSEMETRLARIEFLLSGPLEVKIIES